MRVYLEDAPGQSVRCWNAFSDDTRGLEATVHELRPSRTTGATQLLELLERVGKEARASGAAACTATVDELMGSGFAIEAELRSHFAIT
ncbi:MAG: hypothetical protein IPF41_05140 [Flavobacteriales bacterium]|nr:hypothetical protein [Flavobacteriales bacterium]